MLALFASLFALTGFRFALFLLYFCWLLPCIYGWRAELKNSNLPLHITARHIVHLQTEADTA